MPALPVWNGRKTMRAFEKAGWQVARQRGSHIIMVKAGENVMLSPFPTTRKSPKAPFAV